MNFVFFLPIILPSASWASWIWRFTPQQNFQGLLNFSPSISPFPRSFLAGKRGSVLLDAVTQDGARSSLVLGYFRVIPSGVRQGKLGCSEGESPSRLTKESVFRNERNEWKGLANRPKPSVAERKGRCQRRRKPLDRTTSWKRTHSPPLGLGGSYGARP